MLGLALVPTIGMIAGALLLFTQDRQKLLVASSELAAVESARLVHELDDVVSELSVMADLSTLESPNLQVGFEADRRNRLAAVTSIEKRFHRLGPSFGAAFHSDGDASAIADFGALLGKVRVQLVQYRPEKPVTHLWLAQQQTTATAISTLWVRLRLAFEESALSAQGEIARSLRSYATAVNDERREGAKVLAAGSDDLFLDRQDLQAATTHRAVTHAALQVNYQRQAPDPYPESMSTDSARKLEGHLNRFDHGEPLAERETVVKDWYLDGSDVESMVGADIENIFVRMADDRRSELDSVTQRRWLNAIWSLFALGLAALLFSVTRGEVAHRRSVEEAHDEALQSLITKSERDPLTGLWNRLRPEAALPDLLKAAEHPVVLAYIDLDRFKPLNDVWGHEVGDAVLKEVAKRLHAIVPSHFDVVRFGGDEFVVFGEMPNADAAMVEKFGRGLAATIARPMSFERYTIPIEATVGLTMANEKSTASELLLEADAALIAGQLNQRGSSLFYDREFRRDTTLVRALPDAMRSGELSCFFQPEYALASGRVTGIEALVRWHRGDEVISPAEFVPLAESFGLMERLTRVVLASVAAIQAEPTLPADCRVWMNVSPVELETKDFALRLVREALRAGVDVRRLGVEITETAAISDPEHLGAELRQLRDAGIRVAIDDFGNGYSPLGHLRDLPFDVLKLDRSMITDVDSQSDLQVIVRGIIEMMSELGVEVVAEGVERIEELEWVRDAGADVAQGFLYARPMPQSEVLDLLVSQERLEFGSEVVS